MSILKYISNFISGHMAKYCGTYRKYFFLFFIFRNVNNIKKISTFNLLYITDKF